MNPAPQLPAMRMDDEGAMVAMVSSRNAKAHVELVAQQLEAEGLGLKVWAKSSPDRLDQFYTKMYAKTIQKEVAITDKRSIEDVIDMLDEGGGVFSAPEVQNSVDEAEDEHYE